jgi:hypothetical protein
VVFFDCRVAPDQYAPFQTVIAVRDASRVAAAHFDRSFTTERADSGILVCRRAGRLEAGEAESILRSAE